MDIIKYHLRTDKESRTVAGWTMNLDGKEYCKEVILDDGFEPDEGVEHIVIYNAGDNLATIVLGPFPLEDIPDNPTEVELLKLQAYFASRDELVKLAQEAFKKNGWNDNRT